MVAIVFPDCRFAHRPLLKCRLTHSLLLKYRLAHSLLLKCRLAHRLLLKYRVELKLLLKCRVAHSQVRSKEAADEPKANTQRSNWYTISSKVIGKQYAANKNTRDE